MKITRVVAVLIASLLASPALAHTGVGTTSDLTSGFLHPIGGLDHVLAMVAAGLFASVLGGRARWALPATFVAMMILGGTLGFAGLSLPGVEGWISLSVVVLGLVVMVGKAWPIGAAAGMVGGFAIFHGYAHGAEMPVAAGAGLYTLGFVAATALLHAVGVGAGIASSRPSVVRLAGAAVAVAGLAILAL
ncbi:HupE/UreJ family protein [Microvirga antarctica]|uniref:HupE/UreJ family protein n=1 Tax=Microvirga antarctica TaxID=2819233 RepID=UPI001B31612A|nr:HupE/UreJ family protein [Microvirga antarctica]